MHMKEFIDLTIMGFGMGTGIVIALVVTILTSAFIHMCIALFKRRKD